MVAAYCRILSGWLQRTAGDSAFRYLTARERHMGFICSGSNSSKGAARGRPGFVVKPSLGARLLIFLKVIP